MQNLQHHAWKLEQVNGGLEEYLTVAFRATAAAADRHRCSLRTAAFVVALERVAEATRLRGF